MRAEGLGSKDFTLGVLSWENHAETVWGLCWFSYVLRDEG